MKEEFVLQQESFSKRLIEVLKQKFSRKIVFDYTQVIKTNDSYKPALVVREEGHQVGKTVYLDDVFKQYESGRDIEDIADDLVRICEVRSDIEDVEGSDILAKMQDFEYLLDGHCVLKLINREKSQKYLEGKTFLPFLDLAIVFCMTVDSKDGMATVAVPETASQSWGLSVEEAFTQILDATEHQYPVKRKSMYEFMIELLIERLGGIDELGLDRLDADTPMFIQTNNAGINGASTILYKESLADFCDEIGVSELFILPSSLHEVILVPKDESMSGEMLQLMVAEVNETQVAEDERLSNSLYLYSRKTNEITIWSNN